MTSFSCSKITQHNYTTVADGPFYSVLHQGQGLIVLSSPQFHQYSYRKELKSHFPLR